MMTLQPLLDILLGAILLALAWRSLVSPDLFRAIILFIVFGLTMAMAWARLAAPDIALAEAGIGAGVTGALLLSTLSAITAGRRSETRRGPGAES